MIKKREISILIYILLIIGILKFWFFSNLIIPPFDAYEFLLMARSLWETHSPMIDLGTGNYRFAFHEPGYAFLIALFYPFFHDFELSARFVTVMASVVSILLIYLIAEKIKAGSGKFAALIIATSSLHLSLSDFTTRDIVSFCFVCFILYYFYARKSFSIYRITLLGVSLACASLVHLSNIFLLFPFLYLVSKEKKILGASILLGSYAVILGPYMYFRIFIWPWSSMDPYVLTYSGVYVLQGILDYFKTAFLKKFMRFDPLILILGLLGLIHIALKKDDTTKPKLINKFWGIYWVGYLSFFCFWFIRVGSTGDTYLISILPPLILTGSLYVNDILKKGFLSVRQLKIIWLGINLIILYMVLLHWKMFELFMRKTGIPTPFWLKWVILSAVLLISAGFLIRPLCKKLSSRYIIVAISIALSIQLLDEIIQIKGKHIMANRGKELSPDICILKGKILPADAFFIGVEDTMAILYHTGYPLSYKDFDRLSCVHAAGKKWTDKNMAKFISLSRFKPVICVYDYVYRYYMEGLGKEPYKTIQEDYSEALVFSNLKLNTKIYVLNNTSKKTDYKSAVNSFTARLQEKPDDINLLNYLGWAYFCSGKYEEAILTWRKRLTFCNSDADTYNNLGLAYARKGEYDKAVSEYEKALQFQPLKDPLRIRWARAMIYFNLGQAFEKKNDKKNAAETWKNFYNSIPYPENQEIMERHIETLSSME